MDYLLAHDLGTSADKAVLYSITGELVAEHSSPYPTHFGFDHSAEQDAEDWWQAFCLSTQALLEQTGISPARIAAVSFSGHMNACLPVDRDGLPLRPAMIWADQRAGQQAKRLCGALGDRALHQLTGQRISASSGIAKMAWFKEHEPESYRNTACFLQVKDYVALRLSGSMATDYSDASHLGLLDIVKRRYAPEILDTAGIAIEKLPEMLPSTALAGRVSPQAARLCGLKPGTPVYKGGGDGPCATAGAGVWQPGQAYVSMGTSAWVAALSRDMRPDQAMSGFHLLHVDGRHYMSLGAVQSAGMALDWAIDLLCPDTPRAEALAQLDSLIAQVPAGSEGLYFLPYLMGERSPWWNADARGCFLGLTAQHGRRELLRAVMEGIGYNMRIVQERIWGERPAAIIAVGGGARQRSHMQILADIWGSRLDIASVLSHASSLGAALCAGIGIGAIADFSAGAILNPIGDRLAPNTEHIALYDRGYERFLALYEALEPILFREQEEAP